MASACHVTAADYRRYFGGAGEAQTARPVWDGVERRVGAPDRRQPGHDRRWENAVGRRTRLADRRRRVT